METLKSVAIKIFDKVDIIRDKITDCVSNEVKAMIFMSCRISVNF